MVPGTASKPSVCDQLSARLHVVTTAASPAVGAPATSTSLACRLGLTGEWTWRPGIQALADELDSATTVWRSRLCTYTASELLPEVEIPAVAGRTAWPDGEAEMVVLSVPNRAGIVEDTSEAAQHGPLGILLDPWLAGTPSLPAATRVVVLLLGTDTIGLSRGEDRPLNGPGAVCAVGELSELADAATQHARRLAKLVTQIKGVTARPLKPHSGRFVITTPQDPDALLGAMAPEGVAAGSVLSLPEYPGSFAVTCRADVGEAELQQYAAVLGSVLGP